MTIPRKGIHLDRDAFFAAVEQRDFPNYRGQPVIVDGDPERRGVVATCSDEARRVGVRSAMSAARARQLCPQAIFVRPRFAVYRQISSTRQAIFRRYTRLIEPVVLDAAYRDDPRPTTDELIAMACAHCQGEAYPTPERLIENLPVVRRGLCDYVLSGEADAYHIAYAIASLIEVIEQIRDTLPKEPPSDHAH